MNHDVTKETEGHEYLFLRKEFVIFVSFVSSWL